MDQIDLVLERMIVDPEVAEMYAAAGEEPAIGSLATETQNLLARLFAGTANPVAVGLSPEQWSRAISCRDIWESIFRFARLYAGVEPDPEDLREIRKVGPLHAAHLDKLLANRAAMLVRLVARVAIDGPELLPALAGALAWVLSGLVYAELRPINPLPCILEATGQDPTAQLRRLEAATKDLVALLSPLIYPAGRAPLVNLHGGPAPLIKRLNALAYYDPYRHEVSFEVDLLAYGLALHDHPPLGFVSQFLDPCPVSEAWVRSALSFGWPTLIAHELYHGTEAFSPGPWVESDDGEPACEIEIGLDRAWVAASYLGPDGVENQAGLYPWRALMNEGLATIRARALLRRLRPVVGGIDLGLPPAPPHVHSLYDPPAAILARLFRPSELLALTPNVAIWNQVLERICARLTPAQAAALRLRVEVPDTGALERWQARGYSLPSAITPGPTDPSPEYRALSRGEPGWRVVQRWLRAAR